MDHGGVTIYIYTHMHIAIYIYIYIHTHTQMVPTDTSTWVFVPPTRPDAGVPTPHDVLAAAVVLFASCPAFDSVRTKGV